MTEYSVLEYLRGLLRQCPFLAQEANGFFVDYSERESPVNYGLYPTGEQVLQAYMDGGEQIQYDFVLQTVNATPEDVNRAENQKFINWWYPIKNRFASAKARRADKDHKYFTCKNCKTICRVPAGKGKIVITCPKCGQKIEGRS